MPIAPAWPYPALSATLPRETATVADPVTELTDLRRVREYRSSPEGWLVAIAFHFREAVLHIERVNDTDEVRVDVGLDPDLREQEPGEWREVGTYALWQPVIGVDASYWWIMTNQRGYHDGVQVEFAAPYGGSTTRWQWITEAAYLRAAVIGDEIM